MKIEKTCSVLSQHQVTATIEALERAGLPLETFNLFRSDRKFAEKIVRYANNLLLDSEIIDQQILSVLSVFGNDNYFGPADWLRFYGIKIKNFELPISIENIENLSEILNANCPFTNHKRVKETHYLFYLPSHLNTEQLSINKWRKLYQYENRVIFNKPNGTTEIDYQKLDFSQTGTNQGWHLMYKGVPPVLVNKNKLAQTRILDETGYQVPEAKEVVSMLLLIQEKNGYVNYDNINGRTNSSAPESDSLIISTEGNLGSAIYIHGGSDNRNSEIGMFAEKKL